MRPPRPDKRFRPRRTVCWTAGQQPVCYANVLLARPSGGCPLMRLTFFAAALVAFSTAAGAQVCYIYGSVMTCSNGTAGFRYRNSTADPNATQRRNETTSYYGDPDGAYYGSTTTFNDRRTAYTYGSTTVTADGRTCYRTGDALICNRPYQGLVRTYTYSPTFRTTRGSLQ